MAFWRQLDKGDDNGVTLTQAHSHLVQFQWSNHQVEDSHMHYEASHQPVHGSQMSNGKRTDNWQDQRWCLGPCISHSEVPLDETDKKMYIICIAPTDFNLVRSSARHLTIITPKRAG